LYISKLFWDIHWFRRTFFCSVPSIQMSNFHVRKPGLRNRQLGSIPVRLKCMFSSLSLAIYSISCTAFFFFFNILMKFSWCLTILFVYLSTFNVNSLRHKLKYNVFYYCNKNGLSPRLENFA